MATTAQYHKPDNILPKYFPNSKCDTLWNTYGDLSKRLKYHCRLADDGKLYFNIYNNNARAINRRVHEQRGLHIRNIYISPKWKYSTMQIVRYGYAQSVI